MDNFSNLYAFLEFAKNNRKYAESTANNLKSALKIFEKTLNEEELESISLVEQRINEIFLSVVNGNRDKNIVSLNAYKARVLRIINDYKKYGADPSKLQNWQTAIHKSTPLLNKKDIQDKKQDKQLSQLSGSTNTPVHKIELALRGDEKFFITIPRDITPKEAEKIKKILDCLTIDKGA